MIRYESFLVALVLSYCFFALGECVLDRQSRNLFAVNEAFLTGLSLVSASFFPLSIIFPGTALTIVLVILLCVGAREVTRTTSHLTIAGFHARWTWPDPITSVFFFLLLVVFAQFWYANFRISLLWDGFQIWATKAMVLYHDGALGKKLMLAGVQEQIRINDYPPMVPLFEALLSKLRGPFQFIALKPVFDFFYVSFLVSMYYAARALVSQRIAIAATALLALVPEVSTRFTVGGQADMPQACLVAAAMAAMLYASANRTGLRSPVPWLVGGMIFVKPEGIILAAIACTGIVASALLRSRENLLKRLQKHWVACGLVFSCFIVRRLTSVWLKSTDRTYGPLDRAHFQKALTNLVLVPKTCLRFALQPSEWGLFWPAFAVAALIVLVAGSKRERWLTLTALTAVAAYTSIFYFTNWPIEVHVDQAYNRLLTHVSPVAAVVMAVAFQRLWGSAPVSRTDLMLDTVESQSEFTQPNYET